MAENQSSDDTDTEENSQEDGAHAARKKPRYISKHACSSCSAHLEKVHDLHGMCEPGFIDEQVFYDKSFLCIEHFLWQGFL